MEFKLWHAFVLGAVLSWGVYVPVLHEGQTKMGGDVKTRSLRGFLCVGIAYFLTAVVIPVILMLARGEKFEFSTYGATFAKEFQQASFSPVHVEVASYGGKLVSSGGPAVNGMYLPSQTPLFLGEDAAVVPEVALFDKWHNEADASTPIALWGVDGWMSAALFVQALRSAGQNPTRASLVAALDKITNFTDNGMLSGSNPAAAVPPSCFVLAQVQNGIIKRIPPTPPSGFICNNAGFYKAPDYKPMIRPTPAG